MWFCSNYWRPVHAFLRRSGCPEADAQDLTQDFFITFMGREGFAQAERGKGRFLSFLLSCVRNHFTNACKAASRLKRGGGLRRLNLDQIELALDTPDDKLIALNDAVEQLAAEAPVCAELVKLRFFCGLSLRQTAATLKIAPRTADRHWAYARAWLFDRLTQDGELCDRKS